MDDDDKKNVLSFPGKKIGYATFSESDKEAISLAAEPANAITVMADDINDKIVSLKMYHVQETLAHTLTQIFQNLDIAGFALPDDEDIMEGVLPDSLLKESAMITECLRSLMYRHHGIKHPFQKLSDEIFVVEDNSHEQPVLSIVDELNIKLEKEKKKD